MLYTFAQPLLLRMPVKSPADYSTDPQIFLDDHFFRAAVRVATPVFFTTLQRRHFRMADLSGKEANTLQKYINRYCFRPTPFGLFSSVTLVKWIVKAKTDYALPEFKISVRAAMAYQNLLGAQLLEHECYYKSKFESNPSIYRVLNEYRFFRTGLNEAGKQRDYQLQSIAFSKLLKDLVIDCTAGCSRQEIVSHIIRAANCTTAEAEDYAGFLIDAQLLVNCLRVSITGEDYLTRLTAKLKDGQINIGLSAALDRQLPENTVIDPMLIDQLKQNLHSSVPVAVGQLPGMSLFCTR